MPGPRPGFSYATGYACVVRRASRVRDATIVINYEYVCRGNKNISLRLVDHECISDICVRPICVGRVKKQWETRYPGKHTGPHEFFFGQTFDLEIFAWINFVWIIENKWL